MKHAFTALAVLPTVSMLAQAEPVNLVIWGLDGDNGLIPAMAQGFDDANDDVTVEFRAIAFDDLVNETLKAVATGNAPDMIAPDVIAPDVIAPDMIAPDMIAPDMIAPDMIAPDMIALDMIALDMIALDNADFAMFSSRGAMLDITDRIAASTVIKPDTYYPGPWASVMWDGKVFGVPKSTNTIALFYNKDLMAKAGIATPPETWDDLLDAARKLNDPANKVYGLTWSVRANEQGTFQFLPWIQMAGGDFAHVNGEGVVKALDLWKTLIDEKLGSQDVLSQGQWDSIGTFNAGNAAMAISGPRELGRMSTDAKFDWGVTLLPTQTKGGPRSFAMGDFNWGIFATTQHPDEAFRAIEYFASQSDRLFPEF